MNLEKLRLQPGESIFVNIDAEVSVFIKAHHDKLTISGPMSQLSKTAIVSTNGMILTSDVD